MQPIEIDFGRHNLGVDPGLHIWGWEIPVYLFLGGIVAGLMVMSALLELRLGRRPESTAVRAAPILALLLLSLGMGALFLDLGHKLYVWRFYLAFKPTSPMSWGSWILVFVYPAAAIHALGGLAPSFRARILGPFDITIGAWSERARTGILWTNAALGVGLGLYTGLLLGTAPARILWNTAVLGPLFLVSGLSTGAALLLLFPLHKNERHLATRVDAVLIVAELALLGLFLTGLATGGAPQRAAAAVLLGGGWTAPFWTLVIVLGLVTPLGLAVTEMASHRAFTRLAPMLVLVGGFSLRAILVAAGQDVSFAMLN